MEVIPDDYDVITEAIFVENSDLELWEGAKLYFIDRVEFAKNVTSETLNAGLAHFKAKEPVYCHASIKKAVASKCDRLKTKIISYEGQLLINEGQTTVGSSDLSRGTGPMTIVNEGVLDFSKDVTPGFVEANLEKIYNYGVSTASSQIAGVIRAKAIVNEGPISETDSDEEDEESFGAGNIGVLKL